MDEWSAHANKSNLFSANNLLNLSSPPLTGGTGPLMNTTAFSELTVFNNPMKSRFRTSECCLDTSFDRVCRTMFVTVGYSSAISRILSFRSLNISQGKQRTLVFLPHILCTSFTAESNPQSEFEAQPLAFPVAFYFLTGFQSLPCCFGMDVVIQ